MTFHPQDIIRRKRDRQALSAEDIHSFVHALTHGQITDAQTSALLMALFLNGLNPTELATLTQAMRDSGETFEPSPEPPLPFLVDKHSTGGVGDKTSLLLAPILAAAGLAVPMISGRSLGHTGGTLDKLETIPGFDTQLSLARFEQVLRQTGACLIGQTPNLVPADRILYALRDHTSTVESPYLITASIMSKKLAEHLDGLVLDVKTGSGAFLSSPEDARVLARLMVETGEAANTRTVALLTHHAQPIGRYSGNWLEVKECTDILQNQPHPLSADLLELTHLLAGWMLHLGHRADTPEAGAQLSARILASGAAYQSWLAIVEAQGGDTRIFLHPEHFHTPGATTTLHATHSGFLSEIDTRAAGWAVQRLGAGRLLPGGPVDAHAGIEIHAKLGDPLTAGQPLVTLHAATKSLLAEPLDLLRHAYQITPTRPTLTPQLLEVIRTNRDDTTTATASEP